MSDLAQSARSVLELYTSSVRSLLEEHKVPTIDALNQASQVLETALARRDQISVCFLGESQVGKSTLINAILEQTALPSGGVGPLTAQATRVAFSPEPG